MDIAVADRPPERDKVPALLLLLVRDLARELVRWRPRQWQLQQLAKLPEVGALHGDIDIDPGKVERVVDRALRGRVTVAGTD